MVYWWGEIEKRNTNENIELIKSQLKDINNNLKTINCNLRTIIKQNGSAKYMAVYYTLVAMGLATMVLVFPTYENVGLLFFYLGAVIGAMGVFVFIWTKLIIEKRLK